MKNVHIKKSLKKDIIYYLDSKMYLSLYFNIYNDESDTTEWLIWSDLIWYFIEWLLFSQTSVVEMMVHL